MAKSKKLLGVFLAITMLLSLLPGTMLTAGAADNITVTIDTGASVTLTDADGDGYYDISTANALYAFAAAVNGRNDTINGELLNNITVNSRVLVNGSLVADPSSLRTWIPIGSYTNYGPIYAGSFDGHNYTVSGLYAVSPSFGYLGLFGMTSGTAQVQNVSITDSYFSGKDNISGIAGRNRGLVKNCHNDACVIVASGNGGGVVGQNQSGTITHCTNSGTVEGEEDIGGIAGQNSTTVRYCANFGSVSGTDCVGGVVGSNINSTSVLSGCYNLGSVSASRRKGGITGFTSTDISDNIYLDTCGASGNGMAKSAQQFASGEVAYLLQSGVDPVDGVIPQIWGQDLDNGKTVQTYPTYTGAKVYQVETSCGDGFSVFSNTKSEVYKEPFGEDGFCTICGGYEPATVITSENRASFGFTDTRYDGYYAIRNAGNLFWFAALVNGDKSVDSMIVAKPDANAVLIHDIDLNPGYLFGADGTVTKDGEIVSDGWRRWNPIANTENVEYIGVFDGNHHIVSGVYRKDTAIQLNPCGFFGSIGKNAVVKNLGLHRLYIISSNGISGGIAGGSSGEITDCYVTGYVEGEISGGGIAGTNSGKITNCYVVGKAVINDPFDGYMDGYAIAGGVAIAGTSVNNCYYHEDVSSRGTNDAENNTATAVTEKQFLSGEVAYLLNGDRSTIVFGQTIGKDAYPVFGGEMVYVSNGIYHNEIKVFELLSHDAEGTKATTAVAVPTAGTYYLVFADYEGARLNQIDIVPVTAKADNSVIIGTSSADITLGTEDKIMLMKNITFLSPLCDTRIVK